MADEKPNATTDAAGVNDPQGQARTEAAQANTSTQAGADAQASAGTTGTDAQPTVISDEEKKNAQNFNLRAALARKDMTQGEFEQVKASLIASGQIAESVPAPEATAVLTAPEPVKKSFDDWFRETTAPRGDAVGAQAHITSAPASHIQTDSSKPASSVFELPPAYFTEFKPSQLRTMGYSVNDVAHITRELNKHDLQLKPEAAAVSATATEPADGAEKPIALVSTLEFLTNDEIASEQAASSNTNTSTESATSSAGTSTGNDTQGGAQSQGMNDPAAAITAPLAETKQPEPVREKRPRKDV